MPKETLARRPLFKSLTLLDLTYKSDLLVRHAGIPLKINGPRIAFSRSDAAARTFRIRSMSEIGGDNRSISDTNVADQHDDTPAISPKNGRIAFSRGDSSGSGRLFIMDTDGKNQAPLTNPPSGYWDVQPAWSANGKHIAFVRSYQIWLMNADGTNARTAMTYPTVPFALDHAPAWNPTRNEIAFWRDSGATSSIMSVSIDTTKPLPVTTTPLNISNPSLSPANFDAWPSWSPSGDRIAFFRNHEIWTMDADGTSQRNISQPNHSIGVEDMTPCWSPDGDFIAFSRTSWVAYNIWTMRKDGTQQNPLTTENYVCDFYPSWQAYA